MKSSKHSLRLRVATAVLTMCGVASRAPAQLRYEVLHAFGPDAPNGSQVQSPPIQGRDGRLHDTAGQTFTITQDANTQSAKAPPGTLDPTFGSGGKVTTSFGGASAVANAVAMQADGKIVVVGEAWSTSSASSGDFAVARYNSDGSLDATFGSGGKVTTDFTGEDGANAVAIQQDGKIVVAGFLNANGFLFKTGIAIARYLPSGQLDSTFGTGGKVVSTVASGPNPFRLPQCYPYALVSAQSLAIQSDGRIVVAGSANQPVMQANVYGYGDSYEAVFARYNPDGTPDRSLSNPDITDSCRIDQQEPGIRIAPPVNFGDIGDIGNCGGDYANECHVRAAVMPGGQVLLAARQTNSDPIGILWRFLPNGQLDATFNRGGPAPGILTFASDAIDYADVAGLAIQSDNRAVMLSVSAPFLYCNSAWMVVNAFELTRVNLDGSLDTSFGAPLGYEGYPGSTYVFVPPLRDGGCPPLPPPDLWATALQFDGAGRTVLVGRLGVGSQVSPAGDDFVLTRVDATGNLDRAIGGGSGYVTTDFFGLNDRANAVAVQPNGSIVVAGFASTSATETQFAVVRYIGDDGTPPSITTQPQNQTVAPGQPFTVSVTATGAALLSYQWYVGASGDTSRPLPGSVSATYNSFGSSTFSLWVRVSNSVGHADSATATITVSSGTPPTITTQPQSQAVAVGQPFSLTVVSTGTPPLSYQWYTGVRGDTSHPLSSSGATYSSIGSVTSTFWVRVSNLAGSADSADATITVQAAMSLDRTWLIFGAINTGGSFSSVTGPQTVRMTQNGSGTVTWTATPNQPWLQVSPTSGSGGATLTIAVRFVPGLASTQSGTVTLTFTGAGNTAGPITVTLNSIAAGTRHAPFGSFDTPTNGSTGIAGSIPVTGWALDDVQVMRVTICRDAVSGENAPIDPNCAGNAGIYIGDAVFVDGARPDVQVAIMPLNSRAGWGYLMLTNFLPNQGNGTFTLHAYAFDADGQTNLLGSKTITCDNAHATKPFGAIDTPTQGGVVSGTIANLGWVLTQPPKDIPADSSTVTAFIDGVAIGNLDPSRQARSDITSLFSPTYDASHAAGGKIIDTTQFANGVHTIFWIVSDTGGQADGVGSRFFTISNGSLFGGGNGTAGPARSIVIAPRTTLDIPAPAASRLASPLALESEIAAAPADLSSVQGRRGFDLDSALQTYQPSAGQIDVQAEELDRIELHLRGTGHHRYSGYLQTPGGLKPLPVGSSLDPTTGTFTWMPGVGFYGTYHLTFVRWADGNAVTRQDVRITLNAWGSNRIGPQTVIDAPRLGATVGSPFYVGGWAADLDSTIGTGVNTVHVWAYPIDARGHRLDPIFLGPAIYGGARPDVAAVYGKGFGESGYGIVVNGLAPGTYDIALFAYSTVVNTFTPATVVRITVR